MENDTMDGVFKEIGGKTIVDQIVDDIANAIINGEIKPNEGFSLNSLLRGILGMLALLGIAYIFSSNRKKRSFSHGSGTRPMRLFSSHSALCSSARYRRHTLCGSST